MEDLAFGQNARIDQALGVIGMLASGIPLFLYGFDSFALSVFLWLVFLFSFLVLYILGGHALIYGPHLFIFGFIALAILPFERQDEQQFSGVESSDDEPSKDNRSSQKN